MANPARFTFDLDLRHSNGGTKPAATAAADVSGLVEAARNEGHAQGVAEAQRSATVKSARQLADAAASLAQSAARLVEHSAAAEQERMADAVALAASVGRKLAGQLLARFPAAELEALITECLETLEDAPHLVIRCHPDLVESIDAAIKGRLATSAFSGRVVVIGDPDRALADGRIEWVDGGLVRDADVIQAEIDTRIAAFLATLGSRP